MRASATAASACLAVLARAAERAAPPRQMEALGRGVVAVRRGEGQVFVGWRLLATDPDGVVRLEGLRRAP